MSYFTASGRKLKSLLKLKNWLCIINIIFHHQLNFLKKEKKNTAEMWQFDQYFFLEKKASESAHLHRQDWRVLS